MLTLPFKKLMRTYAVASQEA